MAPPTNQKRIDSLESQVSGLSEKMDLILEKLSSNPSQPTKDTYELDRGNSGKVKIISSELEEMTTDEAMGNISPEPVLMGEIQMDRYGKILDPAWRLMEVEDGEGNKTGESVYIKCDSSGNEIKRISTFEVDQNRKNLEDFQKKNSNYQNSLKLAEMETRNPEPVIIEQ